ncbi:MAG: fatty acid desaturase [Deltaproteobacteria bacterium]|nr:fatty acid desaturase [Deltaproteobacteria bacterium]
MLRYREDRRSLGFVATYFALLAVAWVLEPPLWLAIPLWLALASFSWFCAVITHNTIHCPIFHDKRANRAFQVVLTLTYGHPVSTFVPGHNLSHHKFTEGARDVMRTTKARFRWHLLNGFAFFLVVAPGIVRGERAFVRAMRKQRPRWFRQLLIEAAFLIGLSAVFLVLDWQKFLIWWYLPHLWAAFGIVTMNLLQHDGCDPESEFNHSRNFTSPFFAWWTFNNGWHTIHHDIPGLHWSLAPARHQERIAPHIHPALEQPSMAAYLWRTFIWPGKRIRYDGTPYVLPGALTDEPWAPSPGQHIPDLSLGAESYDPA